MKEQCGNCPIKDRIALYTRAGQDPELALELGISQRINFSGVLSDHFRRTALTYQIGCDTGTLCRIQKLQQLSPLAQEYILKGTQIEKVKDREEVLKLKTERLWLWDTILDHSQKTEVIGFGIWWQKKIQEMHGGK